MNGSSTVRNPAPSQALPIPTLVLLVCGMGIYLGWQTVGISPTLFPRPQAGIAELLVSSSYLQICLFLILLVLFAWYAQKKGSLLSRKRIIITTAILTCASSVCLYLCGWIFDIPAGVVVGSLINASKAVLLLLWAECMARIRFRDILLSVSLAYLIAFALCLLVAGLKDIPALITHSILPLLSGTALLVLRSDRNFLDMQSNPVCDPKLLSRLPKRPLIGIGFFGAVILVTNTLSETKSPAAELYTLLAGLAVSLAITVLATRRSEQLDFTFLYRMLTPLIIASLILVLTLESGNQQYEAFAIGISWAFFRIFTWTLWSSIALRSHAPTVIIFAAGQFALTFCSTLAQLACDNFLHIETIPIPIMISAIIALAVITSAFVMSESEIKWFFERSKTAKRKPVDREKSIAQCIEWAAKKYGLSKREIEIVELVMQNKNNTVIQEQLNITDSTLRTHLRNIYGKLSVHSRQELIDLLFSCHEDDTDIFIDES